MPSPPLSMPYGQYMLAIRLMLIYYSGMPECWKQNDPTFRSPYGGLPQGE